MLKSTRIAVIALLVAIATGLTIGVADDPPAGKKTAPKGPAKPTVMQKKLAQAQKLLEGLAINDFAKVIAAAEELEQLRKDAGWMMIKTPEYNLLSVDFSRQLEAARRGAKDKNIDAVALAYVDMTLTCVKCHKHVREVGIAMRPEVMRETAALR